jgi:DNA-binding NarL/FixJ family response regulator
VALNYRLPTARQSEGDKQMGAVSLLVADDHDLVRQGLRALIQEQPGWQVAAEATNGRDAVAKASQFKPDVAILDITMPLLNGLDATKQIATASPRTKVLILTIHESDLLSRKAIEAGARGYMFKADAACDLITAVTSIVLNKTFFTPKVGQMVLNGYLGKGLKASDDESLRITGREREIVQLLAEGKRSHEVATLLALSIKTVETHRANILRKLNCNSVTELVRYAVRNHIIEA